MKKHFRTLAVLLLMAGSATANAVPITITGQGTSDGQWEVTSVTASFNSQQDLLNDQVWWGDRALALVFADAVGASLGTQASNDLGAFFVWGSNTDFLSVAAWVDSQNMSFPISYSSGGVSTFAVASRVAAVPEPASLALLAAALFGMRIARRGHRQFTRR